MISVCQPEPYIYNVLYQTELARFGRSTSVKKGGGVPNSSLRGVHEPLLGGVSTLRPQRQRRMQGS